MRATVRGCAPMRDDADGGTDVAKRDGGTTSTIKGRPLSRAELGSIDAWWRAANYLSVGQIYLMDNPLLREPLLPEHVKPRLLGHWGTTPGLNFVYAHLNRAIIARDLDMMYVIGPGHGGPGLVASAWLEGTYSEVYPDMSTDAEGMRKLFRQFSFPGGIPSHVAPETPGSIHEGGELGYSLSHAYGAAFDNPDLVVAAIVGDGEAETGPLATSWHSHEVRRPATRRRGAADPAPQRLQDRQPDRPRAHPRRRAREPAARLRPCAVRRRGLRPRRDAPGVRRDPGPLPRRDPRDPGRGADLEEAARRASAVADDRAPLAEGVDRPEGGRRRSAWRATGDRTRSRSPTRAETPRTVPCSRSGCAATAPRSSSTPRAPRVQGSPTCIPAGERRMSANPHANGGVLLARPQDARLPRLRRRRGPPRHRRGRGDPGHGHASCGT